MHATARRRVPTIDLALGLALLTLVILALAGCQGVPPYAALHIGWTTIPPAQGTTPTPAHAPPP